MTHLKIIEYSVNNACPCHGSWATFIRLSHVRAKGEFPTL